MSGPETFRGYPVRVRRFTFADRQIDLLGPDNFEALIDQPEFVERFYKQDEFLPYWAEFWPACLLLAEAVAEWPTVDPAAAPVRVVELGCGLALPSLVAAARGYAVIASDYDEDALAFVRESARRNDLPIPETRFIDWRERYADLIGARIIAAEILYEARSIRPIADFLAAQLTADSDALICDRNRSTADAFPAAARDAGLEVTVQPVRRDDPEYGVIEGRLFHVRKPGA